MTRLHGDAEPRPTRGLLLHTEPRRPQPSPPDAFESVHIIGSEMCAAGDVFLRGQLLPYKQSPPLAASPASACSPAHPPPTAGREDRRCPSEGHRHRRAESLDRYARGSGAASRYRRTKGSLSADYQRLRPVAEEPCDAKAGPRSAGGPPPSPRPKWYLLAFGSVRVPAEMDMRSIKSRLRRGSSDLVRADSTAGSKTAGAAGGGGGAWKLLRSLSCKGDVGGVVDAPFRSYGFT